MAALKLNLETFSRFKNGSRIQDPGFLRSWADLKNKVAKVIYFIWFSNKCFEQLDYILEATVLVAKELKIGVSRRQQREGSFP